MMLDFAAHASQRTEKKKKQSRSEFAVGLAVRCLRDVFRHAAAAAAAVIALGACTEAACSGRGLADNGGSRIRGEGRSWSRWLVR